jgi:TRAP-type C4-dicarboxylate transport system substrate-binding protein
VCAVALVGLIGWSNTASAQSPTELRYATSAPPKTVWAQQIEAMEKLVTANSKNTLKLSVFLNSQLGSEQDTIQQVARGRIDMGGYSITAASLLVPELALLNIPFLFESQKQQDCVLDNHVEKVATDMLAAKGVVMLNWAEVGVASIIGKKPHPNPADVKGLKSRSQPNKVAALMWTKFGANPAPLPVTEWNAAFQSGLIDLADSSPTYYFFSGLSKLAPVVTRTAHQDQAGVIIINKGVFDKLSAEHKKVLTELRKVETPAKVRSEIRGFEGEIYKKHIAAGGQVIEITDAQRAEWRKGIQDAWPQMVEAVGNDAPKVWKVIQDGIKACAK